MGSMTIGKSHSDYTVIYEKSRTGWGAYPPDPPGCGATGRTLALVKRRIRWAIVAHIQGLREDGLRVPRPRPLV
jgi:predicted RNase H-like HicB family nuclease